MNTIKIHGLKCDNPKCDYQDNTIKYEDYKKYIGAKCPKCGMVLLTRKEYLMCKFLVRVTELSNKIFKNAGDMQSMEIKILDRDRFMEEDNEK